MSIQAKCVEVHCCTEYPMYKQEVRVLKYKLLSARVPGEGADFCLLEAIITVYFHSNQELGDFDKEWKACGGLKGKRMKGVCKSPLAFMILRKGQLALRSDFFSNLISG